MAGGMGNDEADNSNTRLSFGRSVVRPPHHHPARRRHQRRLQGKPPCSDLFGVKGRRWLAGLELPPEERESVDAGIRHIEFLDWRLEITAGAPQYTKAARGIWSSNLAIRQAERQLAEQAEASYKRMVKDQQAGAPAKKVGASVTAERA